MLAVLDFVFWLSYAQRYPFIGWSHGLQTSMVWTGVNIPAFSLFDVNMGKHTRDFGHTSNFQPSSNFQLPTKFHHHPWCWGRATWIVEADWYAVHQDADWFHVSEPTCQVQEIVTCPQKIYTCVNIINLNNRFEFDFVVIDCFFQWWVSLLNLLSWLGLYGHMCPKPSWLLGTPPES